MAVAAREEMRGADLAALPRGAVLGLILLSRSPGQRPAERCNPITGAGRAARGDTCGSLPARAELCCGRCRLCARSWPRPASLVTVGQEGSGVCLNRAPPGAGITVLGSAPRGGGSPAPTRDFWPWCTVTSHHPKAAGGKGLCSPPGAQCRRGGFCRRF